MDEELKRLFATGIQESLPILRTLLDECTEPRYELGRNASGGRQWALYPRPNFRVLYGRAQYKLTTIAGPLAQQFCAQHPDYQREITSARFGFSTGGVPPSFLLLQRIFERLWEEHQTFACKDSSARAVVDELDAFVSRPTARLKFYTVLVDFEMTEVDILLPGNLRIRRMSDDELAEVSHREPAIFRRPLTPISEFVLEGKCEDPTVFGTPTGSTVGGDEIITQLSRTMLALQTFKSGTVSRGCIHFTPAGICFFQPHSIGYVGQHAPIGFKRYRLTSGEIEPLRSHVQLVSVPKNECTEMALNRLADAEARTRPQDRLLDAVIGMEALLLAAIGSDRGELKFRFSLNYSTLFPPGSARYDAYKVAGDLYKARNKIAHGGEGERRLLVVGSEELSLEQAANRATECLRKVVEHFLPGPAKYKNTDFWERAYFGLDDQVVASKA